MKALTHNTKTNMQVRQWLAIGVDPNIADFEDPDEAETPLLRAATYDRSEVCVCACVSVCVCVCVSVWV
jgi:hypothetical protein